MDTGHFPLTKWMSNNEQIIENFPQSKQISDFCEKQAPVKLPVITRVNL